MRTLDLTPLFRSTVGFDRLNNMFDSMMSEAREVNYPPYNIEKFGEGNYTITMALAGFSEDDIDITYQENQLVVIGNPKENSTLKDEDHEFLHRGIAKRAFEHKFQLADHIKVLNADMVNGLLVINLEREVPEALKPKKISIGNGKLKGKVIEGKATKTKLA